MTIYRLSEMAVGNLPDRPLSIATGNFDGVHIGHAALLRCAREQAAAIGGAAAVWSFTSLVKSDAAIPALTTKEEKLRLFAEAGMEYAILVDFPEVRQLSPKAFVQEHLIRTLHAAAVVCGFNFHFGAGGAADAAQLAALLADFGVPLHVIPPVTEGNLPVSSTRIRAAVLAGDMAEAARLLGRPFAITGEVLHGKELGRTIGLPTLNQDFPAGQIIPKSGIYASRTWIEGQAYAGVTNIGTRPSVPGDGHINAETHLLDFSGSLYGQALRVELHRYLREEQRFASLSHLEEAIRGDIRQARAYFHKEETP